jgi:hypothetical protein
MNPFFLEHRDAAYHLNKSHGGKMNFSTESDISYLEILSYSDLPTKKSEGRLNDASLLNWIPRVSLAKKKNISTYHIADISTSLHSHDLPLLIYL